MMMMMMIMMLIPCYDDDDDDDDDDDKVMIMMLIPCCCSAVVLSSAAAACAHSQHREYSAGAELLSDPAMHYSAHQYSSLVLSGPSQNTQTPVHAADDYATMSTDTKHLSITAHKFHLTLSVLNNFFNFVPRAEYVYTGLCCIML